MGQVVHVASCPRGELSTWRVVHVASCPGVCCPWGELSLGQSCPWGEFWWGELSGNRFFSTAFRSVFFMVKEILISPNLFLIDDGVSSIAVSSKLCTASALQPDDSSIPSQFWRLRLSLASNNVFFFFLQLWCPSFSPSPNFHRKFWEKFFVQVWMMAADEGTDEICLNFAFDDVIA